jgi:hypothetical protein
VGKEDLHGRSEGAGVQSGMVGEMQSSWFCERELLRTMEGLTTLVSMTWSLTSGASRGSVKKPSADDIGRWVCPNPLVGPDGLALGSDGLALGSSVTPSVSTFILRSRADDDHERAVIVKSAGALLICSLSFFFRSAI